MGVLEDFEDITSDWGFPPLGWGEHKCHHPRHTFAHIMSFLSRSWRVHVAFIVVHVAFMSFPPPALYTPSISHGGDYEADASARAVLRIFSDTGLLRLSPFEMDGKRECIHTPFTPPRNYRLYLFHFFIQYPNYIFLSWKFHRIKDFKVQCFKLQT